MPPPPEKSLREKHLSFCGQFEFIVGNRFKRTAMSTANSERPSQAAGANAERRGGVLAPVGSNAGQDHPIGPGGANADRLGKATGPGAVEANHARVIAARSAETASDDIRLLSQPGVLRCCNCGLAVTAAMRLPVYDPQDAILRPAPNPSATADAKAASDKGARDKGKGEMLDYVRVVLEYDELRTPSFEYSQFVACTPPCALAFAYDHPSFQPSQVPHMHANMMWERHRVDEPTVKAPSAESLAYINSWHSLGGTTRAPRGLSAKAFYRLLADVKLQGRKQTWPAFIPPVGDEEQTALERRDPRFLQYYNQDLLPPHVIADLKLPPELDDGGLQQDANPDSDTEADLALDVVHPPPPAARPP